MENNKTYTKREIKSRERIKPRKTKERLEDLPLTPEVERQIATFSHSLLQRVAREELQRKYASASLVLKLIGAGAFIAASFVFPTLPMALKPFLKHENSKETWKRFNLGYLKRTLARLEDEKLLEVTEENGLQTIILTEAGRRRILKYTLADITINKPSHWDGTWYLLSYDIPRASEHLRTIFREYLRAWRFYQLHESVYLHAYPCEKEVTFLREYLGIGKYVRVLKVSSFENDSVFREYFGV